MKHKYVIPEHSERFDIVVSGQTLEHIANPFKIFDELLRVLKTNGIIVIIVPSALQDMIRKITLDLWTMHLRVW